MANLLKQTLLKLSLHGKTEADVIWAGNVNVKTTWENFKIVADVEYDDGYGGPEVAVDLLIVGNDFWLERHEYDGSEWWEYKTTPKIPEKNIILKRVVREDWETDLEGMNKDNT